MLSLKELASVCIEGGLIFLDNRDTDLNVDPTTDSYYPTVFFNEFWLLRDKLTALNETVKELALNLEVSPISMTKWQLFLQIEQSFQVHRSYGSMLEGEADELKVYMDILNSTHSDSAFAGYAVP